MLRHFRLADRRGILSDGRGLSPIQLVALNLIMSLDDRDHREKFAENFKLQLVGSDPGFWANKLYPEYFDQSDDDDEFDLETSGVEWVMPEMTEAQMQELLDEMMAKGPAPMTFDEYEQQEDW